MPYLCSNAASSNNNTIYIYINIIMIIQRHVKIFDYYDTSKGKQQQWQQRPTYILTLTFVGHTYSSTYPSPQTYVSWQQYPHRPRRPKP